MPLVPLSPPGNPIYRLAWGEDPWEWTDWSHADPETGTFNNRFDDPLGHYRVIYACTRRLGAFVETLARFRPDSGVVAALARVDGGRTDDAQPSGVVPSRWRERRSISSAIVKGTFVDMGNSGTLAYLRKGMARRLGEYDVADLDAAAVLRGRPRRLHQAISRSIYELSTADGKPQFTGIAYRSKLGDEFTNWAIFEPGGDGAEMPYTVIDRSVIRPDDPDFLAACELLDIQPR